MAPQGLRALYLKKGITDMKTETLTDRVYQVLRERIVQGEYAPGQKLNLVELARDLEVSNTPVREAIVRLERIGLVEMIPYCNPKVKRLTWEQLGEIFDVRMALEELAVRLAARRNDPDRFAGMVAALTLQERVCREDDPKAVVEADRAFHDALVRASGNSILLDMLPTLSDQTRLLLELNAGQTHGVDREAALRGLQGHRRVYESLRDGDPDAAVAALRRELTRGREKLLQMVPQEAAG